MDMGDSPAGCSYEPQFEVMNTDRADNSFLSLERKNYLTLKEKARQENRILMDVEYMDDQTSFFPPYEHVSFPSRSPSLFSGIDRISPVDPNHDPFKNPEARYSSGPVQIPMSFHNSIVVQEPVISAPMQTERTSSNHQLNPVIDQQNVSQDNFTEFIKEEFAPNVEDNLILMQESNSELTSSPVPLILTTGAEYPVNRDFLEIKDEQTNSDSVEIEDDYEDIPASSDETNKENNSDPATESDRQTVDEIIPKPNRGKSVVIAVANQSEESADYSNDSWCDKCNGPCTNACASQTLCTIADKPVPSRAVATLPESYLYIKKLSGIWLTQNGLEFGVFAKCLIQKCTQFGPIEGILIDYDGAPFENALPLLYESENGEFFEVDVSNEDISNWMRFVRPARTYKEQNLIICQRNDEIVFLTTRNIMPREELKAGPSVDYARRRNLKVLRPDRSHKKEFKENRPVNVKTNSSTQTPLTRMCDVKNKENAKKQSKEWKCIVCNLIFKKSYLLNLHLFAHSAENDQTEITQLISCPQCGLQFMRQSELVKHVSRHGRLAEPEREELSLLNEYKCSVCYKRFSTKVQLQQHYVVHNTAVQKQLPCRMKRFTNTSSLSEHLETRTGKRQVLECSVCNHLFNHALLLREHVEIHKNQDNTFSCPHCQKVFLAYDVLRKHIRLYHNGNIYKCQICGKHCISHYQLRKHSLKHSDYREFFCANCDKGFKRKDKLKEHILRMHDDQKLRKKKTLRDNRSKKIVSMIHYTQQLLSNSTKQIPTRKRKAKLLTYNRYIYKCHYCLVGFRRRGILVNHFAKWHPDISPDSVPELSLPILHEVKDYFCHYCDKVYKSNSKRKTHIMRNHPSAALPFNKESDDEFIQTAGIFTTDPYNCPWCHKQYAKHAKLLQHQRKKHPDMMESTEQVQSLQNQTKLSNANIALSEDSQIYEMNADLQKDKMYEVLEEDSRGQQIIRILDMR